MVPRVKPSLDDLLTTADIGRMLGTSRQFAHQLTRSELDFPEPIGRLGHYMVWWRPEVEQWIARNRAGVYANHRLRPVA
jgi:predicted DNA-binding transcriptional regulator AlpA